MVLDILMVIVLILSIVNCYLLVNTINKYNEAVDRMKNYTEMIIDFYKIDEEYLKKMTNHVESMEKLMSIQNELSDKISSQYEILIKNYNTLADQHKKLLECWGSIERRYSDTYEQFREITNGMKKISEIITAEETKSTVSWFPQVPQGGENEYGT